MQHSCQQLWLLPLCTFRFPYLIPSSLIGIIKLKNNGDFFLANEGKRPIYVDGSPVLCGSKWKLCNNSVVEVSPEGKRLTEPWTGEFLVQGLSFGLLAM